ncbi:glycoside hydrolase family 28 protein [Paenibacillus tarimensis]
MIEVSGGKSVNFSIPDILEPDIPDYSCSITSFGAVGDGMTVNTEAIRQAVDACVKAGGGTVVIPAGMWLTGPIRLESRIRLHTERGAVILFSSRKEDYPLIETQWEGNRAVRCMPPIYGERLRHVAVTGEGLFDGNGDAWRPVKRFKMTAKRWAELIRSGGAVDEAGEIWWPEEAALQGASAVRELDRRGAPAGEYEPYKRFLRPVLLGLYECSHVLLSGPTFQNSPAWNLHLWGCEHVTLRSAHIRNPWYAQNGDGLDLESCRYALVEDCTFDVGDDAICMKSGKNEQGRMLGKPVQDVIIRGCTVYHGHGGFVVGSEMSGGARNMLVEDCVFIGTDIGLRFKSTRGRGGVVENIVIRNIRMKEIEGAAISFNLYYGISGEDGELEAVPVTEETPEFRNIAIEDTVCIGAQRAVELIGLPERPLHHMEFKNVKLSSEQGVFCRYAEDIVFEDLEIRVETGPKWMISHCDRISR